MGAAAAALVGLLGLASKPAQACGGTFCDAGPQAMPVDQTGENILFVMGDGWVEAHIQIQYDPETEAESFAWVIPLVSVPEFAVSSQALFEGLLQGSVPTYGFQTQRDQCASPGLIPGNNRGGGDSGGGWSSGGSGGGDGDGDGDGGPQVVLEETVGAFEVVIIQGGTAQEIMAWLDENGYQQDPAAEPILEEYLAEDHLFAAFKLVNGADTGEIHPISLRFDNTEACIPLRLTRIAAAEDMEVRSFFLGNARVVPQNYRHVVINPLKIDWTAFAQNYKSVITLAVDADHADGKAFVTEYAGPSSVARPNNLYHPAWEGSLAAVDPQEIPGELTRRGLMDCSVGWCQYRHALIEGLLTQFLPPPPGISAAEYYNCPACYEDLVDYTGWDGQAFEETYRIRITEPAAHAAELLETWPYLTRMYTTISPGEMTEDPFFHENPHLPEVVNTQVATQRILCSGDRVWILPDGREVYVPQGEAWPSFPGEMPWEEDVERMLARGAPEALSDRTDEIDAILADHNAAHDWPRGCGCRVGSGAFGTAWARSGLGLLGLLALRRRRS